MLSRLTTFFSSALFKSSFLIGSFVVVSQVLGAVRDRLLIHFVGMGHTLDLYNASFRIPDLIYSFFIAYVAATTVIPLFSKSIKTDDTKETNTIFSTLLIFFSCVLIISSIIVIATVQWWIGLLFLTYDAESSATLSMLIRIMMLQPILLGISNLISVLAQAYKRFLLYSIAPLFYNGGIIISTVFFYRDYGVQALVWGTVFGALLHLIVQSFIFKSIKARFTFSFRPAIIKAHSKIAIWRSLASFIIQFKKLLMTIFASFFGAGVISAITYAQNLINIGINFLGMSHSVASFPDLTYHYEAGENKEFRKKVKQSILFLVTTSVLASLILYLLAHFIVSLIYGNTGTEPIIILFSVLLIALPFLNLEQYLIRMFMAMRRVRLTFFLETFSLVVFIISFFIMYRLNIGYVSLAYALLIATVLEIIIMLALYRHFPKRDRHLPESS